MTPIDPVARDLRARRDVAKATVFSLLLLFGLWVFFAEEKRPAGSLDPAGKLVASTPAK
jgi:hypothetical protein